MMMKSLAAAAGFACTVLAASVCADGENPSPEQIKKGAATYAQSCAPCHGPRMLDPQGAFDLRIFPKDQKARFITSVAKGKNQMPPWAGLLSADDIEALWAYTLAGDRP